jgi:uncharacterized membrane protein
MRPQGNMLGAIAFAVAFLGYQFLLHKVTLSGPLTPFSAALIFIPFVIATGWAIALELGLRLALLITTIMTMLGLAEVYLFGLPPAIIFGLPHLVTNLFLMWFFARTLKDGREPLITSIARRVHGSLTPDIEIYTRHVTFAWSLFFALQVVVSLGLYIFASLEVWSVFINILNAPLIILMFVCEYAYRILRYREHQSSILSGFQFFARADKPTSKSTKPR